MSAEQGGALGELRARVGGVAGELRLISEWEAVNDLDRQRWLLNRLFVLAGSLNDLAAALSAVEARLAKLQRFVRADDADVAARDYGAHCGIVEASREKREARAALTDADLT
jgi:hypothetical protein